MMTKYEIRVSFENAAGGTISEIFTIEHNTLQNAIQLAKDAMFVLTKNLNGIIYVDYAFKIYGKRV